MTAWVVRAGADGTDENSNLNKNMVSIRWDDFPEKLNSLNKDDLREYLRKIHPNEAEGRLRNWLSQLYSFGNEIQKGDIIVLPFKNQPSMAVGRVRKPYYYENGLMSADGCTPLRHIVEVEWRMNDLLRIDLDEETLRHLNRPPTVFKVNPYAERRIIDAALKRGIII